MKGQMTILTITVILLSVVYGDQPNPPTWPSSVKVFTEGQKYIQETINQIFAEQGGMHPENHGQWSNSRYALLFMPGDYSNINVPVGYYTGVYGLGQSPPEVILGDVTVENGAEDFTIGALDNFWRSAEGFTITPQTTWFGNVAMLWAVSQGAPLRRVQINGDLLLFQYISGEWAGYASGGFMSDVHVSGKVTTGSQQQFMFRNSYFGRVDGGVWNMVFVGCENAPADSCGNVQGPLITKVLDTPVIAEKPYIVHKNGKYSLFVPDVKKKSIGKTNNYENGKHIDFSKVLVATEDTSVETINNALADGYSLILCAGNYNLAESIKITRSGTIVLGIGFPTLTSSSGKEVITVDSGLQGVRIASLLLQAGTQKSPSLLRWGSEGSESNGDAENPGFIYDLFARVGGTNGADTEVSTDIMMQINDGNVVIDNTWLWRADHGVAGTVKNSQNPVATGLQVNGDYVTAYGVAVEHTLGDLLKWNGENGQVYFYQSEFPYDVTQANYGDKGFTAYHVNNNVNNHHAYGIGAYSFFLDNPVTVTSGIKAPSASGILFHNSLCVWLNGNGQISHVINNQDSSCVEQANVQHVCNYN